MPLANLEKNIASLTGKANCDAHFVFLQQEKKINSFDDQIVSNYVHSLWQGN